MDGTDPWAIMKAKKRGMETFECGVGEAYSKLFGQNEWQMKCIGGYKKNSRDKRQSWREDWNG